MSARLLQCQISCESVHWGLVGKRVKYNENISRLRLTFLMTGLLVRPVSGFSRAIAQTTRPHAGVKPFGV